MKSIIEISRYQSGEKEGNVWVRLLGLGEGGRHTVAHVAMGPVAAALRGELDKLVPPGEDIASRRLLVDFEGNYGNGKPRFRNGKPETRADGSPAYSRVFYVDKFTILNGPTLELARNRRDASVMRAKAEALAAEGKFEEAYGLLDDLAARVCNLPPRTPIVKDDLAEDEEFGETTAATAAPRPPEDAAPARAEPTAQAFATHEAPADEVSESQAPANPAPEAPVPEAAAPEAQAAEAPVHESPAAESPSEEAAQPAAPTPEEPSAPRGMALLESLQTKPAGGFDPEAAAAEVFAQENAQLAAAVRNERRAAPAPQPAASTRPRPEPVRDVLDDEAPGARVPPSRPAPQASARPASQPAPARSSAPAARQPEPATEPVSDAPAASRARPRGFGMRPAGFRP